MKHLLILIILLVTVTVNSQALNPFQEILLNQNRTQNSIKGTTQESKKRFYYAIEAAKKGNVQAQYDLAMMYARGVVVAKNERLAFGWFHKAARAGSVQAKYMMGISFNQGRGVRAEKHLARYWFKLAAKAGHPRAGQYLALLERNGGYRG